MILNHKQEELVKDLVCFAKKRFPEIKFEKVTPGPEDPNDIWVWVSGIGINDDQRYVNFSEYVAREELQILLDYGYQVRLTVMTDKRRPRRRKTPKA